eukprot:1019595-Prorocentrum_minimum.AAC.1
MVAGRYSFLSRVIGPHSLLRVRIFRSGSRDLSPQVELLKQEIALEAAAGAEAEAEAEVSSEAEAARPEVRRGE